MRAKIILKHVLHLFRPCDLRSYFCTLLLTLTFLRLFMMVFEAVFQKKKKKTLTCGLLICTLISEKRSWKIKARTYLQQPLRQWVFWQCLPFSWTTLRGKHYGHPIAVMGVVYTFRQGLLHTLEKFQVLQTWIFL